MDADLYSSTKFVLDTLRRCLEKNAIKIFDEYFGYVNWRNHEHRALLEWAAPNGLELKYLAYTGMQVAVQLQGN